MCLVLSPNLTFRLTPRSRQNKLHQFLLPSHATCRSCIGWYPAWVHLAPCVNLAHGWSSSEGSCRLGFRWVGWVMSRLSSWVFHSSVFVIFLLSRVVVCNFFDHMMSPFDYSGVQAFLVPNFKFRSGAQWWWLEGGLWRFPFGGLVVGMYSERHLSLDDSPYDEVF
jgi:hypothetical protein